MEGYGWVGTIIIGGLAGWIAGAAMGARLGLLAKILVGIAGGVFLNFVLIRVTGSTYFGLFGQLAVASVGAIVLIYLLRAVRM